MVKLTRSEEIVMQVLWNIKSGAVKSILQKLPLPKPAYNTISTIVSILRKKGFVDYKLMGRTYVYFAIVSKNDYREMLVEQLLLNYFNNSGREFVRFVIAHNLASDIRIT